MEQLGLREPLPFEVGALYSRRDEIHARFGGPQQGGISPPAQGAYIFLFTGEAGKTHGYSDKWGLDENGGQIYRYYGEGQRGPMEFKRGNLAIRDHVKNGKRLLLFRATGKGQPYRFEGEFFLINYELDPNCPDSDGNIRTGIVFNLAPLDELQFFAPQHRPVAPSAVADEMGIEKTIQQQLVQVRSKQSLFRRRLLTIEKGCRLTGIRDLRFLVASHIKPWSQCETGTERVDGHNGLLLAPHADHLFDKGWITFECDGRLVVSERLPTDVRKLIGLNLKSGLRCGAFDESQQSYLTYHRDHLFEKKVSIDFGEIEEALEVVKDISSAYKQPA